MRKEAVRAVKAVRGVKEGKRKFVTITIFVRIKAANIYLSYPFDS